MSALGIVALCVSVVGYLWAARFVFREMAELGVFDWADVCWNGVLALLMATCFQREVAEREERIARLERELGVGR